MTKWIKSDNENPSMNGNANQIYIVLYERYYPELMRNEFVPELAIYDYCISTDRLAWMRMKDRENLSVIYWCELPEPPND